LILKEPKKITPGVGARGFIFDGKRFLGCRCFSQEKSEAPGKAIWMIPLYDLVEPLVQDMIYY
jgi:hypothetical protein